MGGGWKKGCTKGRKMGVMTQKTGEAHEKRMEEQRKGMQGSKKEIQWGVCKCHSLCCLQNFQVCSFKTLSTSYLCMKIV